MPLAADAETVSETQRQLAQCEADGEKMTVEITRLTDALWEYGQHRPICRIGDGKECDCGFFDVIKSLKE